MGLDEVSIDLSTLPEGLIAIQGDNGMGKTVILDSLHPFRTMPYRAQEGGAFSFYNECSGKDARKELRFMQGGEEYRSTIIINAVGKKQEAYLFRRLGEEWTPLNDGKTRTYDQAIREVCGDPELFFLGPYRCQRAKSIASYPKGEIKAYLSDMLGLGRIQECAAAAHDVRAALLQDATRRSVVVTDRRIQADRIPELEEKVDRAQEVVAKTGVERGEREEAVEQARSALRSYEATRADQEAARRRRGEVEAMIRTLQGTIPSLDEIRRRHSQAIVTGRQAEIRAEVAQHGTDHQGRVAQLKMDLANLRGERERLQDDLRAGQDVLRMAEVIRGAGKDAERAEAQGKALRAEERDAQERMRAAFKLEGKRAQLRKFEQDRLMVRADCDRQLRDAKKKGSIVESVPCHAAGECATCGFLTDAVEAKAQMPDIYVRRRAAEVVGDEEKALADELLTVSVEGDPEGELKQIQTKLEATTAAWKAAHALAAKLPELERQIEIATHGESRLRELEGLIAAKKEVIERADADHAAIIAPLLDEDQQINQMVRYMMGDPLPEVGDGLSKVIDAFDRDYGEAQEKIAGIEAQIHELRVELEGLTVDADDSRREALTAALTTAETNLRQCRVAAEERAKQLAVAEDQLRQANAARDSVLEADLAISKLHDEAAIYATLQQACGDDGIIALEIDDAGPAIAGLANQLLDASFGPRFQVAISTQAVKADGGKKEVLDILVLDGDAPEGEECRPLAKLSVGERTWVEAAISAALATFNNERAAVRYDTAYADEDDGALDPEHRQVYVAMRREILRVGGFSRQFFISHDPAVWLQADARITVRKGGIEVAS